MLPYIADRECPSRCGEDRGQADPAQILGVSRYAMSLRDTGRTAWRIEEPKRVTWYTNSPPPVTDLLENSRMLAVVCDFESDVRRFR